MWEYKPLPSKAVSKATTLKSGKYLSASPCACTPCRSSSIGARCRRAAHQQNSPQRSLRCGSIPNRFCLVQLRMILGRYCTPKSSGSQAGSTSPLEHRYLHSMVCQFKFARFARIHGTWQTDTHVVLEVLLVALADNIRKGKRIPELESRVVGELCAATAGEQWEVFATVYEILERIGSQADARLAWQNQFPVDREPNYDASWAE
jgi:hypothetical protein